MKDGVVETVTVDMGEPVLSGLQIPVSIDAEPVLSQPIEADGTEFTFTAVSMGNPHCVIYVEDAVNFDLATWGPKLEVHPLFPRKVNVEFATVLDRGEWICVSGNVGQDLRLPVALELVQPLSPLC